MQSIAIPSQPALYMSSHGQYVACDEADALHIVPACSSGWAIRRPYRGHRSLLALQPASVPRVAAWALGIPFASRL